MKGGMAVLAAVSLAGLWGLEASGPEAEPDDGVQARFDHYRLTGTSVVGFRGHPQSGELDRAEQISVAFTPEVTAVLAELRWDAGAQDLDLWVHANVDPCDPRLYGKEVGNWTLCTLRTDVLDQPGFGEFADRDGSVGSPDLYGRVLVDRARMAPVLELCGEGCHLSAVPWGGDPYAAVGWELHVTVFYGPVPEGYSALGEPVQ